MARWSPLKPQNRHYLFSALALSGIGLGAIAVSLRFSAPSPPSGACAAENALMRIELHWIQALKQGATLEGALRVVDSVCLVMRRQDPSLVHVALFDSRARQRETVASYSGRESSLPVSYSRPTLDPYDNCSCDNQIRKRLLAPGGETALATVCFLDTPLDSSLSNFLRSEGMFRISMAIAAMAMGLVVIILMLERQRLIRCVRFLRPGSVDRVTFGFANTVRNGLHSMRFNLASARQEAEDSAPLRSLGADVSRVEKLIDRFLSLNSPSSLETSPQQLDQVAREAIFRVEVEAAECGVEISHDLEVALIADLSPGSLERTLRELLANAVEYCPSGGKITINLRRERGRAVLSIEDDGPGLPDSVRAHLFHPFNSSLPDRPGLGLALARGLVEGNGGKISFEPPSRFTIVVPLADKGWS